jgi:glycosyltransferase involved in cell wall biosynthesis
VPGSVSVALCTRNSARFIEAQIRSILTQTVPPGELIVSDDASTDGTVEIIRGLVERSPVEVPLTVLSNAEPIGVTANFQQAVLACTLPLIALSDHDDIWMPDRIEGDLAVFEADPGLLLLHSDAVLIDETGEPLPSTLFESLSIRPRERREDSGDQAFRAYIRRNLVTGAATMFRRVLLDLAIPFPAEWVHDEWLGVIAAAYGGARMAPRAVIRYRQHGDNVIGVREPTLSNRLSRMLEPRRDRYRVISARSDVLEQRLAQLDPPSPWHPLAARKAAFERKRATYPAQRWRRIPRILSHGLRGDYRALSSQGSLDMARDLVQKG